MTKAQEQFARLVDRYGPKAGPEGPVLMVREIFKVEPDPWQAEVLRAFGRGERRISVRSCHGVGKTAVLAWCVWYMLLFRFPQKTVATAPTRGQLFDGLYAEVLLWGKRLPAGLRERYTIKSDRIELKASPSESFFTARTARPENPEALQGIHAEHVLLLGDEASGIPEPIFEAGSGSMSGANATTILAGNPVRTSGLFFDTHHSLKDVWRTWHIRAAGVDWPNGVPSTRVEDDFVEDCARRYGEESSAYRIRVLGEFPKGDEDTVIPYEYVEGARMREIVSLPNLPRVWGVDVARFGSAKNALVERNARSVTAVDAWENMDIMTTAGRIKRRWDDTTPSERPQVILVDVIGIGSGVVDRLRELKLPVRGINVAESSTMDSDRFMNLRAELWWQARDWLAGKDVALPSNPKDSKSPEERLADELVQPKYQYMSSGKIKVEPKSAMRKRGLPSPDIADAFVLTFADQAAVLAGSGVGGYRKWNEPLPSRARGLP